MKLVTLIALTVISLNTYAQNYFVELKSNNPLLLREVLEKKGIEVEGFSKSKQLLGVVTDNLTLLSKIENEFAHDPLYQFSSVQLQESEPFLTYLSKQPTDGAEEYFGTDRAVEELRKLEAEYPEYAKVLNVTKYLGVAQTHEGRDIFALVVGSSPDKFEDKPKLLVIAQHHAREVMTQHAVLDAARDLLLKARNREAWAANAIAKSQIVFLPVLNPDGLNTVMTEDRMWRKNRAPNSGHSKGVDLNRNYGFKWGSCGMNSEEESSEVYKGAVPNSEPEVKVAEALNDKLHFMYAISYHSYGDEVLMPYLCGNLAEAAVYNKVRDQIQAVTGFGQRPPSSSGEDHEWHYNKIGTLAYLLEIGDDFQPSYSTYRETVWPSIQKVVPLMTESMQKDFVEIKVTNRAGKPLRAELSIDAIAFQEGEVRTTDSFGTYRWRLPEGNHTLKVKVGTTTKTVTVNANAEINKVQVTLD